MQALERPRVEEARRWLAAGDMWGDRGLFLTTRLGNPVDPRNFHRDFKLRSAEAGVPVVPIHSTRRTCASLPRRARRPSTRGHGRPSPQPHLPHDGRSTFRFPRPPPVTPKSAQEASSPALDTHARNLSLQPEAARPERVAAVAHGATREPGGRCGAHPESHDRPGTSTWKSRVAHTPGSSRSSLA